MSFAKYELIDELISQDNLTWAKKLIDNIIEEKVVAPKLSILLERFAEALRHKKEMDLARTYIRYIPQVFGPPCERQDIANRSPGCVCAFSFS